VQNEAKNINRNANKQVKKKKNQIKRTISANQETA